MSFLEILDAILLRPLQLIFETVYMIAYKVTGNPGVPIIILSLFVNFLALPLYMRADAIQEEEHALEKKLQRGVDHIKKTFVGDERMLLLQTYYKQNHYKPVYVLRSAVSLFLQIPFFIAAYRFLSGLQLLYGVSFGLISDLGQPDGMLQIAGLAVNVLPVIMTVVNLISCVIFTKGSPLKSKIQLYAMALFFLVFLYNSPAGLVFYWTLNNVFSLIKTCFYKLKNPGKVLSVILSAGGALVAISGSLLNPALTVRKAVFLWGVAALMQAPLICRVFRGRINRKCAKEEADKKLFLSGGIFLTTLTGILIPSAVIKSAPQDFVKIADFYNPLWFVVSSFCLAFGVFIIWTGIFYFLSKPAVKVYFDKGIWLLSGIFVTDYMFFGKNPGMLSSQLQYGRELEFAWTEQLKNVVILTTVLLVLYAVYKYRKKAVIEILAAGILAFVGMSAVNVVNIHIAIGGLKERDLETYKAIPEFTLSRSGKNVIVFMLDMGMGEYIPYFFQEKPELKEKFSGFTYYANTISFGRYTNLGTPALFGGYEYTPVEMNRRDDELMVDKQNEALKVMPVLFAQNGYQVIVCDPPYAGYEWIPDLSIYYEYPDIQSYILDGKFSEDYANKKAIENNHRNFFCYSILKAAPLCLQKTIYDYGRYNQAESKTVPETKQIEWDMFHAVGVEPEFMNAYNVLEALPGITNVVDDDIDTFLMMANNTAHEPMQLQEPDYIPALEVDNTEYEQQNQDRFTLDGYTLEMESNIQLTTYQVNMAALLQLGKWFDYMRENDVYDNTRIIVVADHGRAGAEQEEEDEQRLREGDVTPYFPLLMVKDFGDGEFETSKEFMTNGDVPTLATKDIIEKPINPFTGKIIDNSEKTAHDQYVIISTEFAVSKDSKNTTYLPAKWCAVHDDMRNPDNWKLLLEEETILPPMENKD